MKKMLLIGIGIVGLSIAGARAEGETPAAAPADAPKVEKKAHPPKAKVELKDLTVTGTLEKVEHKKKDGSTVTGYKLVSENGTAYNVRAAGAKKDAPKIDLAQYVGVKVKISGKGAEGEKNNFLTASSVEKVEAAAK